MEETIFVPRQLVLDKKKIKLTPGEILYYSTYLTFNKDIVKTDNDASIYMGKNQIDRYKRHLTKLGLIKKEKYNVKQAKEMTIKLSHKGKICEWCKQESYVLQEHHYPIMAKDGGTKVVQICPNCHYTFHKLLEV